MASIIRPFADSAGRLLARWCPRPLRDGLYASSLYDWTLGGDSAPAIAHSLPSTSPRDPAIGKAMIEGDFISDGVRHRIGRLPWVASPLGDHTLRKLHSFAWLADLQAVATEEAKQRARELVDVWIDVNAEWTTPAWSAEVLGRRLSAWLAAADYLLEGTAEANRRRLLESLSIQARHLTRVINEPAGQAGAIAAIRGWIETSICLADGELAPALDALQKEVERQILSDGCHIERNPSLQLTVLHDLIGIRGALRIARLQVPLVLEGAIERMAPVLRTLRLGDGTLALFNGGKEEERRWIDTVLGEARAKGGPEIEIPTAGFQRLAAGRTVVIVDTGRPPPWDTVGSPHAGVFSFEMSVGCERLIVNCGGFRGDHERWQRVVRTTAAHSTVTVDDANAFEADRHGNFVAADVRIEAARREAEGALWLDAEHDGYRRRFGVVHRRRLYLNALGQDLRGQDILEGREGAHFCVRFHLHPDVAAVLVDDRSAVTLDLPSGASWRFLAVGGALDLGESVYLGDTDVPRQTRQITVTGPVGDEGAAVKWALRLHGES